MNGIEWAVAMHLSRPPTVCAVPGNLALAKAACVSGIFEYVLREPVAIRGFEQVLSLVRARRRGGTFTEWFAPRQLTSSQPTMPNPIWQK